MVSLRLCFSLSLGSTFLCFPLFWHHLQTPCGDQAAASSSRLTSAMLPVVLEFRGKKKKKNFRNQFPVALIASHMLFPESAPVTRDVWCFDWSGLRSLGVSS